MTTTVTRRIPPQRLINLLNPAMRAVLGSPLHGPLDGALLVLHIVGRKTGRRYDIPVGYVEVGGQLIIVTQHRWRVNLRGGTDVDVTYRGRRRTMHADLDESPESVAGTLQREIEQHGWKTVQRQTGLKTQADRTPTLPELEVAVREFDMATITLTDLSRTVNG